MKLILGIETSCDECSASIVEATPSTIKVKSVATHSQISIHKPYGGVVPEIASRNHLETINEMISEAEKNAGIRLEQIDAIAVTNRPGLVGALLVGVSAAKALSYALDKPLVPVHHLEGHLSSIFLDSDRAFKAELPLLCAIVSGGHTNLYVIKDPPNLWPIDVLSKSLVGRSRDDAAGEAFDKTAKILGFPYPGGAWIDQAALNGNPQAFSFPRALQQKSTLDLSFSGLKTAVSLEIAKLKSQNKIEENLADVCASIQEAILDALLTKCTLAIGQFGCKSMALVGGVAANSRLRYRLSNDWKTMGLAEPPLFPLPEYCTDNAAMIAGAGSFRYSQGHFLKMPELLTLNAVANPN